MWEEQKRVEKTCFCSECVDPGFVRLCGICIPVYFYFFYVFRTLSMYLSKSSYIDCDIKCMTEWGHADFKPHFHVFIRTVFGWNVPICFFLCASTSARVKVWMDLSDGEAMAWSYIVWIIQCHVHMLGYIYPHFQPNCNRSYKTLRGIRAEHEIQARFCIC